MCKYRVIKSRKTESDNPIIVYEGDKVICAEESNEAGAWAGWIFCKNENNEGWVPKQIININDNIGFLLEDYDAREFDIQVDEIFIMDKTLNGWIWGAKKDYPLTKGWVPLNHLEKV
ncbi:SH3 domain-containing protein [Clostridium sp.]|uniref:SH3 domain-containing protein n=1 Tax=Clostridium sp. TaxID=1506 RepID=UPI003D6D1740